MTPCNCVRRPAGAEPVRPGVSPPESVVSLATISVTRPAKRRQANVWAVGTLASKTMSIPDAERSVFREGDVDFSRELLIEESARRI
jgi:hypothetical protein